MLTEKGVLNTLRRVPDRIILATLGRDLELNASDRCLCGWFMRERLGELRNVAPSEVNIFDTAPGGGQYLINSNDGCVEQFGGSDEEWRLIYDGVTRSSEVGVIESAFAQRVDEAVYGLPPQSEARV